MKLIIDFNKYYFVWRLIASIVFGVFIFFALNSINEKANSYKSNDIKIELNGLFKNRGVVEVYTAEYDAIKRSIKTEKINEVFFNYSPKQQTIPFFIPEFTGNKSIVIQVKLPKNAHYILDSINYLIKNKKYTLNFSNLSYLTIRKNQNFYPPNYRINAKRNNNISFAVLSPNINGSLFNIYEKSNNTKLYSIIAIIAFFILLTIYKKQLVFFHYIIIIIGIICSATMFQFVKDIEVRTILYKKTSLSPALEIGMVVPIDERLRLYYEYTTEDIESANDNYKIEKNINGSSDVQHLVFNLPTDKPIKKLRLYLGRLPMGQRDIHYMRFRKLNKTSEIDLKSLNTFFTRNHNAYSFTYEDNISKIIIHNQNPFIETQNSFSAYYLPIFYHSINNYFSLFIPLIFFSLGFFCIYFIYPKSRLQKIIEREININL